MKIDIYQWIIMGLLVSGIWVAIIWAIGKYSPSPLLGFLCLPVFVTYPFLSWLMDCLEERLEKNENQSGEPH